MKRGPRIALIAGATTLVLALAVFAILISPLPSAYVTPRIVRAIEARLGPGYSVQIQRSDIDPTRYGLDVRLDGFEIRDPGGARVLNVPSASVALDGNLVLGNIASLRRLKLIEPHLTLRIEASGEVALAGDEGGPPIFRLPAADVPQGAPAEIFGFFSAAAAVLQPGGPFASFEMAEVLRANIVIDDQRRGRVDRIERVDLKVGRQPNDEGLLVSAVSSSPTDRWSATATISGNAAEGRNFDLGFENLALGRLVYEALHGAVPADIEGRLFGHLYARLDPAGAVPTAEARLDVVGFQLRSPQNPDAATDVERMRVQLNWDGKERRLQLAPSDVFAANTRISFGGQARPLDDEGDAWAFSLGGTEIAVPGSDPATQALRFDRFELSGNVKRSARLLTLDTGSVRGRALSVAGYGTFDFGGPKPIGDFAIAGSRSPVAALLRVWPTPVAANARKWVVENVSQGMVEDLNIAVRGPLGIGPQPGRMIALDAKFNDATVGYMKGAPPALDVTGQITVRDRTLDVEMNSGHVDLEGNKSLSIAGTRFSTQDHLPNPFDGELAIKLDGEVVAAGALLSVPPIAAFAPGAAKLLRGGGTVKSTVYLRGPYGKGASLPDLKLSLDADVTNANLPKAVGGKDVDAGNFKLTVDPAVATLRGDAKLSGAPFAVEALINRKPGGAFGETVVTFSIDPSKVKDFASEAIKTTGPVSARLSLADAGQLTDGRFEADLTGASVAGPLGMGKAAGQPGRINFAIVPNGDGWRLANFQAQAGAIDIRGSVDLNAGGQFTDASFTTFNVNEGDDAKLDIRRNGQAFRAVLNGGSFNVQPALKEFSTGNSEKRPVDIDIEAKLGTVLGNNGETLSGADFKFSRRGNTTRNFYLTGRIGEGSIEGRTQGDENRTISVRGGDAGAALRFLDLYRRMRGGQIALDVAPGAVSHGRLIIQNFQVVGDQALASVAHGSKAVQQPQQAARGMTFTKMETKFRLQDGKALIDDSVVYGNELGATLDGEVDYTRNSIGIRGTFVPAYALNNLFGKLPIIGTILGGGSQEGLVGITFEIAGPWTSPVMKVNPLSAVAPGFLRKIFEFRNQNPSTGAMRSTQPQLR